MYAPSHAIRGICNVATPFLHARTCFVMWLLSNPEPIRNARQCIF